MAFLELFKKTNITNEMEVGDESSQQNDNGISDSPTWHIAQLCNDIWQKLYALDVVKNLLSTFLTNVEWNTYKENEKVKGNDWFRLNVAPNKKETAPEFYAKLANKLIYDQKALIIEMSTGEFFIADSYSFKNGNELLLKENTFINVVVGDVTLNRSFKENDSCMYIKMPQNDKTFNIFASMAKDFQSLKELINKGADKALGSKYLLNLSAQSMNKYDKNTIRNIQEVFKPLMGQRDAVFVTYKGETLTDLTERQRGSEVQQVLEAVENSTKVNKEILRNVGSAYGIPEKIMTGDLTADSNDIFNMTITMFAKPILTLLSKKITYYLLTKEDILNGAKIVANLSSIKYHDALSLANSVDKLIGCGTYVINEIREKLGDEPVEGGDIRFITKNYAELSEYTKGGSGNED